MSGTKKAVYGAIMGVMRDLGEMGIGKDRKNQGQGFQFRGIDEIYAALNPLMVRHGVLILPRFGDGTREELTTKSGGVMHSVIIPGEFDVVSVEDGSVHTVRTIGEAQDSGDKASSKAMSIALKYAAFQIFMIPVQGQIQDQEATTPEPTRRRMTDKEKAQMVIWRSNIIDRVDKAQSDDDLKAIKKGGDFKRSYDMMDEAGQADLQKIFKDRSMDFEPPLREDEQR